MIVFKQTKSFLYNLTKTINMKKLLILMLLFTGIVNAQIVNILDANLRQS